MRKLLPILILLISLSLIVGCTKKPPSLEDRLGEGIGTELPSEYTGMIEEFKLDIYQDGTHQIRLEDEDLVVIQSSKINLSNYIGKKVTVKGSMQKLIDNKSQVFTVEKLSLDGIDIEGDTTDFKSSKFGFTLSYPNVWEMTEENDRLSFRSNGLEVGFVKVFSNIDVELDEFIETKEIEDGTPVTIGSQRSLRYTDSDGIKIYTPNPLKEKIYLLSFVDGGEDSDDQKQLFFTLLESFSMLAGKVKTGEKCGGEEELVCEEGYRCELDSGDEDAEGVCIAVDSEETSLDCPFVPVPLGCQHYEPKNTNKDGCATSYVCLDAPEDKEESISDKSSNSDDTDEAPLEEKSESKKVAEAFSKHESSILPDGADLLEVEVIEKQDLLAAIYLLEDEKFRTVFDYSPSADEYNFTKKAHYEAGEERDWIQIDGDNIDIIAEKTIIKATDGGSVQVIKEGMRLYENTHKDFSVQYPKNWYFRSFGSIENSVWSVGFGDKSLDHMSDALISLVILDEAASSKKSLKGDQFLAVVSRDADSHFEVEGPLEEKENIEAIADTIVQN